LSHTEKRELVTYNRLPSNESWSICGAPCNLVPFTTTSLGWLCKTKVYEVYDDMTKVYEVYDDTTKVYEVYG
jgi:hypothetical protein